MDWFKKRIAREIAVLMIALLLTLLLLAGLILGQQASSNIINTSHQQLIKDTHLLQTELDGWFAEYVAMVDAMSTNQDFLTVIYETDNRYAKKSHPLYDSVVSQLQALQEQRPHIALAFLGLANADDLITNSEDYVLPADYYLRGREWYQESKKAKNAVITSPYIDITTKEMIVSISKTIYKDSQDIGVVALDISIDSLYQIMSSFNIGQNGYAVIAADDGQVLYHPDLPVLLEPGQYQIEDFYPESFYLNEFNANVSTQEMSGNEVRQFHQDNTVWYFTETALKQLPMRLIVFLPEDEVLQPYYALRYRYYQLMLSITALSILIALWISSKLAKPITTITNQVMKYEYEKQIMDFPQSYYNRKDELGQLAKGLSNMSQAISQYTEELQVQNEELITETEYRKGIQEKLELTLQLLSGTQEATFVVTEDGKLLYGNEAFFKALRKTPETIENTEILRTFFDIEIWNLSNANSGKYQTQVTLPDQQEKTSILFNLGIEALFYGDKIYYLGYLVNITEEQKQAEAIFRLKNIDSLTNLYTQSYLENKIIQQLEKNPFRQLAYMQINIKGFRHINEARGYHYANKVLIQMAKILTNHTTKTDIAARIAGDEFAFFMSDIKSKEKLYRRVKTICEDLERRFNINDEEFEIKAAVGVTLYPNDAKTYSEIISSAASALNQAKETGAKRIQFFNEKLNKQTIQRFELRKQLTTALEKRELYLEYQPQVNMDSKNWIGLEALVRWNSETGMISPGVFIPLAEETDIILPIGEWILQQACKLVKDIQQKQLDITVSVNLSVIQFTYPYLIEMIDKVIEETNIDPKGLELEITESLLLHNENEGIKLLEELDNRSIKVAIDDFGTGYSSLSYLQKFKVDKIKIDRSFVKDIPQKSDGTIAKIIVELAEALQLGVVAEGIETIEQETTLRQKGCCVAQGFYYSKPLPEASVRETLKIT